MTVESKLAALRLEERELLKTPCAFCGHILASHSRVAAACSGVFGGPYCDCKGFVDPGERLALA